MWVLAIFSIIAGFPKEWFMSFLGEHAKIEAGSLPFISLTLAGCGIFLAYILYQRASVSPDKIRTSVSPLYGLLRRKYFMDDIYEFLYRNGLLFLSTLTGWFDRYIVDGFVNLVSWSTGQAGRILRKLQTGQVQDYLYGVLFGLLVLIVWGVWIGF